MAVVGAYARIDLADEVAIRSRLGGVTGVSTFSLDDPGKVGLVIEADDLDSAHDMLLNEIEKLEGVLGVWPVYAHAEPDESSGQPEPPGVRNA
jgi:nitrate reductase NapAB chaperone NapD